MIHRSVLTLLAGASAAAGAAPVLGVPPSFSNQTGPAGVSVSHQTSGFPQSQYSGGATVGDFNNDGWQDIFVLKGGTSNLPDRLYINNGNGTFTDQAAAWGIATAHKGKGATVGDFDKNGWLDIYVTSAGLPPPASPGPGNNKLYRNNGDSTFTNIAVAAGVNVTNPGQEDSWAACFGDYDLDGDLDLYVGGFLLSTPSNAGNRLFRNNGNATFTDVTASIGLFSGVGNIANLSASFADMNGDRYPELMLGGDFKGVNSFIGSRYFRNNGNATFSDGTVASGTGLEENGMGQTLGDFNNDGRLDWYVTSIFGFPPASWTGNKLYRNLGNHTFSQVAVAADVDDGGYGWGAIAVDLNHDGWMDLAETNGDSAGSGQYANEQSYLWMNDGDATFTEGAIGAGLVHLGKGRALLHFDYDNDGDQDVLISSNNEPLALFRNDLPAGPATSWLRVFLDTSEGSSAGAPLAPNGYGSKVYATVGASTYMRSVDGGESFLGINELSAHFGLGNATVVDELKVEWNDGTVTTLTKVAVNQTLTVSSIEPICPGDVSGDGQANVDDLLAVINAWGPCPTPPKTCPADVSPSDGDGSVNVDDLLAIINAWGPCP